MEANNIDDIPNLPPNLLESFAEHYRKRVRAGSMIVINSDGTHYHSYDPKLFKKFLSNFSKHDQKYIKSGLAVSAINAVEGKEDTVKRRRNSKNETKDEMLRRLINELSESEYDKLLEDLKL